MATTSEASQQPPGPGVDAQGRAVVDPTKNVLDLVNAAIKRQDDIRAMSMDATQRELGLRQDMRQREHAALQELLEVRLDAMDRANELLSETVNRAPTEVTKSIDHLKGIQDERFRSVETQFRERDTRSERESKDNKVAVDAAFAAQKDAANEQNKANTTAINKSEATTTETIKTNQELSKSENAALAKSLEDTKIRQVEIDDDIKKRLGAVEATFAGLASAARVGAVESQLVGLASARQGAADTRVEYRDQNTDQRAGSSLTLAVIGTFLLALSIGIGVASLVLGK